MKKILSFSIVVFLLFTFVTVVHAKPKPKILTRVPNVIGMTAASASGALQQAGLGSAIKKIEVPGKKAGTVAKIFSGSQQISAGKIVRKGTTITLGVVGKGAHKKAAGRDKKIKVPNLKGLTVKSGRKALDRKKLRLGRVSEKESSKDTVGTIIDQSPKSGKTVSSKTQVNVVIAKAALVSVPNLVGKSEKNVARILVANKLKLGRISERRSPGRASGSVLEQKPRANVKVEKNSRVDLVIVAQEDVKLPNVVGLNLKKAETILKQHGYRVTTEYECCPGEFNPNLAVGKVVKIKAIKGKLVRGKLLTLLVPKPMDPGIGAGHPDLMIVEERMTVTVPDPAEPRKVEVTIPVKNVGTAWAHAFTVRWYKRNQLNILGCSRDIVNGLDAGQEAVVTCTPDPYRNHGTMNWRAVVDEESEIAGDPPDNNIIRGQVVIAEFALTPDLEIREVTAQAPDPQRMEEPFSIVLDILIQNIGDVPTGPFTLRWYPHENDTGDVGCDIRDSRGLERDETRNYKCTYTYPVFGMMNWKAIVDEDGEVPNDPPRNNRYTDQTLIEREEKPDLVITEAHYEQKNEPVAQLKSGERFKAVFTVTNRGSVVASPFKVIWRFENNTGLDDCCSTDIVKNLGPDASVTKSFKGLIAPEVAANQEDHFSAIVDVDPENVVDEGDVAEENNEFDMGLSVKGPVPPSNAVGNLLVDYVEFENQKYTAHLRWDDTNNNEVRHKIEIFRDGSFYFERYEDANITASNINGLDCSGNYRFEVHAYNGVGHGPVAATQYTMPNCGAPDLASHTVLSHDMAKPHRYNFVVIVKNNDLEQSQSMNPVDLLSLYGKCFKVKVDYPYCSDGNKRREEFTGTACFSANSLDVDSSSSGELGRTGLKKKCLSPSDSIIVQVDSNYEIDESNEANNFHYGAISFD